MKYVYPIVLEKQPDGYIIAKAPDLPGLVTGGESLPEALQAAASACEMWLADAEQNGESIPAPTDSSAIALADGQTVSLVVADTDAYRRMNDTRAVKKTISIPAWMADQAERQGVSLSQALQETLRARFSV